MSLSSDQLLTWLLVYGYPVLFLTVLLGSLGVPLPVSLLVLAAGGFVADGDMDLMVVLLVVFGSAVMGDCIVYGAARWAGQEAVERHGSRIGLGAERLAAVRARFGTWLGLAIFMTRWLLTPLALPTSLVAGVSRYPLAQFATYVVVGELIWSSVYVSIGYVFGQSWQSISETVQDSAVLLAGLAITAIALGLLYVVLRGQRTAAENAAN